MFSIIVPTIGRSTLQRTLDSLIPAGMTKDDEVIVVADGEDVKIPPYKGLDSFAERLQSWYLHLPIPYRDSGNTPREVGIALSSNKYLLFMDDDDMFAPGALDVIRQKVGLYDPVPHIFRMQYADGRKLWTEPRLKHNNIGSPMLCIPNNKERLGRWGHAYDGDFHFLLSTVGRYPTMENSIVWHEEVIALIRPEAK